MRLASRNEQSKDVAFCSWFRIKKTRKMIWAHASILGRRGSLLGTQAQHQKNHSVEWEPVARSTKGHIIDDGSRPESKNTGKLIWDPGPEFPKVIGDSL